MKFNPKSEKEIQESFLLPDGNYNASVILAADVDNNNNKLLTKNGNEKIDLVISVYPENSSPKNIKFSLTEAYLRLFKHFCDSAGLSEEYNSGNIIPSDIVNKSKNFMVKIGKRSYTNKNNEEIWINNIEDFFQKTNESPVKSGEFFDDTVPF